MRDIAFCSTLIWPTFGLPVWLKKGKLCKIYLNNAVFSARAFFKTQRVRLLSQYYLKCLLFLILLALIASVLFFFCTCLTVPWSRHVSLSLWEHSVGARKKAKSTALLSLFCFIVSPVRTLSISYLTRNVATKIGAFYWFVNNVMGVGTQPNTCFSGSTSKLFFFKLPRAVQ